jgi:hypothetical protein
VEQVEIQMLLVSQLLTTPEIAPLMVALPVVAVVQVA